MRALLLALILALVGWIGGGSWYWVCKVKGNCGEGTEIVDNSTDQDQTPKADSMSSDLEPSPFIVSYQNEPFIRKNQNLRFGKSSVQGNVPESIQLALDSLTNHLLNNPDQDIEITGQFNEDEENPSDFSNLGLARADYFAQLLINDGLDEGRIIKSYEVLDNNRFDAQDSMLGGIRVRLLDQIPGTKLAMDGDSTQGNIGEGSEESMEQANNTEEGDGELDDEANKRVVELAKPDSRDLYFAFKSFNLAMDDELRNYITRTIQYLKQDENKKLVLTGHTDNVGSPASNQELGKNRAETVKRFFEEFGLAKGQIQTNSKGETSPLTTNNTEAGRSKNRRVEIRIQD